MNLNKKSQKQLRILTALMLFTLFQAAATGRLQAAESEGRILLTAATGAEMKEPAMDFNLKDLNGTSVQLSKFKGEKPVLLYFWATWCPYCVEAKPQIAKIREEFTPAQLEILGINVGQSESLEKLKRYQQGHPVSWPILFDDGSKVSRTYQVQGIPLFVVVDKAGNITYRGNALPPDIKQYLK
jgi:peroxiredoxin